MAVLLNRLPSSPHPHLRPVATVQHSRTGHQHRSRGSDNSNHNTGMSQPHEKDIQWRSNERKRGDFMLAVPGGGGGGLGAERDRQVRLHSVRTDLQLGLPPSIPLPDGEELPYGSSSRLHIRDSMQESEIYQKCIRAPPNRTVLEGESPPPYRPASAGPLTSPPPLSGGGGGGSTASVCPPLDWALPVTRSNSLSNRPAPTVQVPAGKRLSALTMVPCLVDSVPSPAPPPASAGGGISSTTRPVPSTTLSASSPPSSSTADGQQFSSSPPSLL